MNMSLYVPTDMCLSQTGKTVPVYEANTKKATNIQSLREKWACTKSESSCPSTYCYADPATQEHIPLSHEHMDSWAMAMVCFQTYICPAYIDQNGS